MVKGRLNREDNPLPGDKAGYNPQYKETDGSFTDITPTTPMPTKIIGNLESTDADVLAKLSDLETKLQATNDKLDGTINTQLTGSLEGLSTDDKPEVIEGYSYLEYDVEAQEMNVYKGISGEWRLL